MTTPTGSRARRIVLAALAEVPMRPGNVERFWITRYGRDSLTGAGQGLHSRMDKLDVAELRASGGRNRMQHRHVERALRDLIAEGLVEHKVAEFDDLYRITALGEAEVARV